MEGIARVTPLKLLKRVIPYFFRKSRVNTCFISPWTCHLGPETSQTGPEAGHYFHVPMFLFMGYERQEENMLKPQKHKRNQVRFVSV